jgi:hypothetical protein
MPANLLLGSPGIPYLSTNSVSATASTTYPLSNLFGGTKVDRFMLNAASASNQYITSAITSGSLTANFLYIGKAITLQKNAVTTIALRSNTFPVESTAGDRASITSFNSATLMGPDLDDYVTTFTTTAGYQYWFLKFTTSANSTIPFAKAFYGNYFDPGIDPTSEVRITRSRPTGARRRAAYTVNLQWEGMTYANTVSMYTKFYRPRRHQPVILFTTSYHDILFGHKVLFGRVLDMSIPPRMTNYNNVSMVFEEIV